jgi:hypothetical protein
LAYRVSQHGIAHEWAATGLRGDQFGDHAVAVRHQHGLAARDQPNIFAELVLQDLEADGTHAAYGSYR